MAASGMAREPRIDAITTLDLRALPAPEPLLQMLDARGLQWESAPCADGGVRVRILHPLV